MEHITLDDLRERENYYNKYSLTNPYLPIRVNKWVRGLYAKYSDYIDIRHSNGVLVNDGKYVLNKGIKYEEGFTG